MKNRMNSSLPSIVVLILALSLCNAEEVWDGFVGKFTETYKPEDGFFPMPKIRAEAIKSNPPYSDIGFKDPDFDVQMYCLEKDPHICLLFDKNGELGGLRKSHLKSEVADDLAKFPYKYDKIPLFKSGNILGEDFWYSDFLFTKPENLKQGGPGRTNTKETAEGIWVKLAEGWTEIPKDECDTAKEGWNHAFFYKWMGNHYAKNGTDVECESHLPLLAIYHYGHLIGLSSSPIGKHKNIARNWFEIVPLKIMKDGSCKKEMAKEYSTSGFHMYLIDDPRTVTELTPAACDK